MKDFAERYLRLLRETPVEDIVFVTYKYLDNIWSSHDRANKVSGGAACSRLQPGGSERPLSEPGATNQTADSVIGSICE